MNAAFADMDKETELLLLLWGISADGNVCSTSRRSFSAGVSTVTLSSSREPP
ncbi:MAG: hypothetical protein OSJ72_09710 [Lachnospiraceae bacterium]|mgnify:CR=1 FL=1|nr:hypothetical protein [Lachnospiraceae bacterium]